MTMSLFNAFWFIWEILSTHMLHIFEAFSQTITCFRASSRASRAAFAAALAVLKVALPLPVLTLGSSTGIGLFVENCPTWVV